MLCATQLHFNNGCFNIRFSLLKARDFLNRSIALLIQFKLNISRSTCNQKCHFNGKFGWKFHPAMMDFWSSLQGWLELLPHIKSIFFVYLFAFKSLHLRFSPSRSHINHASTLRFRRCNFIRILKGSFSCSQYIRA